MLFAPGFELVITRLREADRYDLGLGVREQSGSGRHQAGERHIGSVSEVAALNRHLPRLIAAQSLEQQRKHEVLIPLRELADRAQERAYGTCFFMIFRRYLGDIADDTALEQRFGACLSLLETI
jgi:hypothetical protein